MNSNYIFPNYNQAINAINDKSFKSYYKTLIDCDYYYNNIATYSLSKAKTYGIESITLNYNIFFIKKIELILSPSIKINIDPKNLPSDNNKTPLPLINYYKILPLLSRSNYKLNITLVNKNIEPKPLEIVYKLRKIGHYYKNKKTFYFHDFITDIKGFYIKNELLYPIHYIPYDLSYDNPIICGIINVMENNTDNFKYQDKVVLQMCKYYPKNTNDIKLILDLFKYRPEWKCKFEKMSRYGYAWKYITKNWKKIKTIYFLDKKDGVSNNKNCLTNNLLSKIIIQKLE